MHSTTVQEIMEQAEELSRCKEHEIAPIIKQMGVPSPKATKVTGGVTNYYCPRCGGSGYVPSQPDSPGALYPLVCPVCLDKRVLSSEDELGEEKG